MGRSLGGHPGEMEARKSIESKSNCNIPLTNSLVHYHRSVWCRIRQNPISNGQEAERSSADTTFPAAPNIATGENQFNDTGKCRHHLADLPHACSSACGSSIEHTSECRRVAIKYSIETDSFRSQSGVLMPC